jgi:PKD repeat protein
VHVFTSPGIYFVTLAVSNEVGTADVSHPVEVLQSSFDSPVAKFSVNVTQGSAPLAVQFNDLSSGRNLTFLWTFGDGSVSDIPNPVHLYQNPGTFVVSLHVTSPAGSSTHQTIIEVNLQDGTDSQEPQAGFLANRTEGEIPFPVAFTDSSTGPINNYYWDFGDDTTSTERNPVHVFDVSGVYSVRLFVIGSTGSDWENKINYINATN